MKLGIGLYRFKEELYPLLDINDAEYIRIIGKPSNSHWF